MENRRRRKARRRRRRLRKYPSWYWRYGESSKFFLIAFLVTLIVLGIFCYASIKVDDSPVEVERGTPIEKVEATMWGFNLTSAVKQKGEVDTSVPGEYEVVYTLLGKRFHKTYTVVDAQGPVITLDGDTEMTLTDISEFAEPGYSAIDSYDGDMTEQVTVLTQKIDGYNYQVSYSVTDSSGNLSTATRNIKIEKGIVCLTFDDGPSESITPQILNTLARNNVKATFFLVGFPESEDVIVQQEFYAGHTIGVHGDSHKYSEIYTSLDVLMNNFNTLRDRIKEVTSGYDAKFIRFPGGSSNTVSQNYCQGIMTAAAAEAEAEGYIYYDWNVDSEDAGGAETSAEIYANVVNELVPGRTNVVLMHDSGTHQATADALQKIITYCQDNGYVLEPITTDTTVVHHNIAN